MSLLLSSRKSLLVCLLLPVWALLPGHMAHGQDVVTAGVLRHFPPLYYLQPDGTPVGLGVELLEEIANRAGFEVRYRVYDNGDTVIQAIADGEVDLTSTIGITPQRAKLFDFSLPLETFPVSLFVREGSQGIAGLQDLAGKTVAVVRANSAERLLSQRPEISLKSYLTVEEALFSLLSGNAEAIAFPKPILLNVARQARVEERLKEIGPPLREITRAVAVTKGRQDLLQRINAVIPALIKDPVYHDIYSRWYGEPVPYWTGLRVLVAALSAVAGSVLLMLALHWLTLLRVNRRLRKEVSERQRAEQDLAEARDQLEMKVKERTGALDEAVQRLQEEVAERTHAQEELRTAQHSLVNSERLAVLGQLTAAVSHELRNPLGVIQSTVYTLRRYLLEKPEDAPRLMERIERNVRRCTLIIEDMLEYARGQDPALQPLPFDHWLAGSLGAYGVPDGIEVQRNLGAQEATVALDSERMRRVLINLVENACQSMQQAAQGAQSQRVLSISTSVEDTNLVLRIEDTGPGISEEAAGKLFEPLFSTKSFGVGLGLPIVQRIVESHQGTIGLSNRANGLGASAIVTLPLVNT